MFTMRSESAKGNGRRITVFTTVKIAVFAAMPTASAATAAIVKLGLCRQMRSDLRHSLRILRQSPSFAIAAVAALAIGIAANTAIFTVVNTVILRPLPFADSDRIVNIGRPGGRTAAIPMFTYWEQHNPGFEDLSAYLPGSSMNLNSGDKPEVVAAMRSSRNYFRLFGANPILGR